ncbi:hypothetical protein [Streptomyces sp. WMMC905]|uniref:hypothetical protein n=1 Tax=Streptomyces sp. WMMC905 TaxID=3404123 RepID=UPI003B92407F
MRHPEQPLYGRVARVEPDGTVAVAVVGGELTLHAGQVTRVPPHIAEELDRGPLHGPVHLIDG